MLFRRRQPAGFRERFRTYLWPRRSFSRSLQYFGKRVLRLTATPHAIAAGVAAGIFSSWTPFIGFHFFLAFAIAYLIAGNMAAAAIGTGFGNPLTFPVIWATSYETGHALFGGQDKVQEQHLNLGHVLMHLDVVKMWQPILKPMLLGSVVLGLGFGLVAYGIVYFAVQAFRNRRKLRLAERAKARLAARFPDQRPI